MPLPTLPSPAVVLVVDDDADLCEALASLLTLEGHVVHVAQTGPAAIAAIENTRFQVAVLDVTLREIDGIQIARYLRKRWRDTKILIHTGAAEAEIRPRFDDYDAHLLKGGPPEAILSTIERLSA